MPKTRDVALPPQMKNLSYRMNRELNPIDYRARRELIKAQTLEIMRREKYANVAHPEKA